ncbi:MAG: GNAT family N-acetyltransferase [Beijerinckiaceae bacterium]
MTDYNAPILGPAAPQDSRGARELWRALCRALPPADILTIGKSPRVLRGRPNPLALLRAATPSQLSGNVIDIDGPFDAFTRGFDRKMRKELGREKRVFEATPGARFEIIADRGEAERVFDRLAEMQAARIRGRGRVYRLDEPEKAEFYRTLLAEGLKDGNVALSALRVGDEVVAALLGCISGDHYAMVRLGQAGAAWGHFSPGRLIILETMRALRNKGTRRFDFTIGEYDYKRRLGVVTVPLVDVTVALSWRGGAPVAAARIRDLARRSALLRN